MTDTHQPDVGWITSRMHPYGWADPRYFAYVVAWVPRHCRHRRVPLGADQ